MVLDHSSSHAAFSSPSQGSTSFSTDSDVFSMKMAVVTGRDSLLPWEEDGMPSERSLRRANLPRSFLFLLICLKPSLQLEEHLEKVKKEGRCAWLCARWFTLWFSACDNKLFATMDTVLSSSTSTYRVALFTTLFNDDGFINHRTTERAKAHRSICSPMIKVGAPL